MVQSNKPANIDSSLVRPSAGMGTGPTTSTGLGKSTSPGTPSRNELANQLGETRSAISSDIRELGDKFNTNQLKQEAKAAGKEFATGAQGVVVDKMVEVKDAVVDKAVEVKDAVVDKAVEMKDAVVDKTAEATDVAVEKLGEAKEAMSEALDDAGNVAARWGRAGWRFTTANAFPLAVVGLGASWMIMNNRSASKPPMRRSELQSTRPELYLGAPVDGEDSSNPLDADSEPVDYVGNGRGRKQSTLSSKQQQSQSNGLPKVRREASPLMERGKRQAEKGMNFTRESLSRAKDASLDFVDANPLAIAFGTLALGVGFGLLLPTTDREERLLAPTREKFERLMGDAREVATDVVEMAKETANESMPRS